MPSRAAHNIFLETERIYLREIVPEDSRLLFELDSDPEVMRFISKGQTTSIEQIENDHLPKMLRWYRHSPPQGFWIAHMRSSQEFVGWFHLRPDKIEPTEMELGYRLKRNFWNIGLATEGSRALLHFSFAQCGYQKVSARTLIINLASRRVMEKVGLRFEHEFVWGADVLPGWLEAERRGVKYGLSAKEVCVSPEILPPLVRK